MSSTTRSRTWTPSPVRCASRSSSASDSPVCARETGLRNGATHSFVVTDASPRSLNPTAKSFAPQVPAQGGNALFAMPASRPAPTTASQGSGRAEGPSMRREPRNPVAADAMSWSAAVGRRNGQSHQGNGRPGAYYAAPAGGAVTAATPTLDDAAVQREAELFVRQAWTSVCQARGFHMVMVMNLVPRTCEADLSRMFFPMGAAKVTLVGPKDLPPPLMHAMQTGGGGRRRLGVVFFERKDFAMVAVEKLDNFVPTGQHQPLVVRYCGPDAEATPLSGAPEPHAAGESLWMASAVDREAIQQEMCGVFGQVKPSMTMVAVHGLDPSLAPVVLRRSVVLSGAVGCEPWPPQQRGLAPLSDVQYSKYKSISAVAWYPTEEAAREAVRALDGRVQFGQRQPIHLAVLAPASTATTGPAWTSQAPPPLNAAAPALAAGGSTAFTVRGPAWQGQAPSSAPFAGNHGASQVNTSVRSATSANSVYTDPANASSDVLEVYDRLDQEFLAAYPDPSLHLVGVHNLLPNTTDAVLLKIFYPMGALNVAVRDTPILLHGKARVSGVAFFTLKGMAEEAAKKINDFVPHGQSRPLVARYLSRDPHETDGATAVVDSPRRHQREATPPRAADDWASRSLEASQEEERSANSLVLSPTTAVAERYGGGGGAPQGASTPRRHSVSDDLQSTATVSELLAAIEQHLSAHPLNSEFLSRAMTQLAKHPNSGEEDAEQLGRLFVNALLEANHHSITLCTPISNALYQLHENLRIPRRGYDAKTEEAREGVSFVRGIARAMLSLLVDFRCAREPRSVAAVVCAYFFDFCYLGSPYDFAMRNFRKFAKEIGEAKALLSRKAGVPTTPEEQAKVNAWVTLMDCLKDLTSQWANANRDLASQDVYAGEFQSALDQFYGTEPALPAGGNSVHGRRVYGTPTQPSLSEQRSPYAKELLGSASMRRMIPSATTRGDSELVTPSARPTPRRVIARMSPGGVTSAHKSQPPTVHTQASAQSTAAGNTPCISGVGAEIPHVVLTPFSDRTQGISTDISLESNSVASAQAAAAMAALLAPSSATNESPWQHGRSDNSSCTVYVTKLPSHLTSSQVRRLLVHFGTINKVRLCRDDKENASGGTAANFSGGASNPYHHLSFGFVEFADSRSAKAMIEYFRNQNQSPTAFSFLLEAPGTGSDVPCLTEEDTQMLRDTRTSRARSSIRDEHPLDAELRLMPNAAQAGMYLRVKPCQFGLLLPNEPVENYTEMCEEALGVAGDRTTGGGEHTATLRTSLTPTMAETGPEAKPGSYPAVRDYFTIPMTAAEPQPQRELPSHSPDDFGRADFFHPTEWTLDMNSNSTHDTLSSQLLRDDGDEADAVLREVMNAILAVDPAVEDDDD